MWPWSGPSGSVIEILSEPAGDQCPESGAEGPSSQGFGEPSRIEDDLVTVTCSEEFLKPLASDWTGGDSSYYSCTDWSGNAMMKIISFRNDRRVHTKWFDQMLVSAWVWEHQPPASVVLNSTMPPKIVCPKNRSSNLLIFAGAVAAEDLRRNHDCSSQRSVDRFSSMIVGQV